MSVDRIKELAEAFRDTVRESTGIDLAYSETSAALLDQIIDTSVVGQPAERVERIAEHIGAFLGEILVADLGMRWTRRAEDGRWVVTAESKTGDDVTTNPWNKVFKRIANGQEDSLGYYCAMVRKTLEGKFVEQLA